MNVFSGIGRLTKDVDLKYTSNGLAVARFTIAINRSFKNKNGNYEADFINCVAFGKRAETIANYVKKGNRFGVTGRIQTGSYQNDQGQTVYTTDVVVDGFTFLESNNQQQPTQQQNLQTDPMHQAGVQIEDNDLPF